MYYLSSHPAVITFILFVSLDWLVGQRGWHTSIEKTTQYIRSTNDFNIDPNCVIPAHNGVVVLFHARYPYSDTLLIDLDPLKTLTHNHKLSTTRCC